MNHGGHSDETEEKAIHLLKAHASLAIIGWLFFLNIGSVFARYLKHPFNRVYDWYGYHLAVQVLGILCSLSSFVLAIVYVMDNNGHHFDGVHQIGGLILTILMIPQPFVGWFVTEKRVHAIIPSISKKTYEAIHCWLARILIVLAFLTIGAGLVEFYEDHDGPNQPSSNSTSNSTSPSPSPNTPKQEEHHKWISFALFLGIVIATIAIYVILQFFGSKNAFKKKKIDFTDNIEAAPTANYYTFEMKDKPPSDTPSLDHQPIPENNDNNNVIENNKQDDASTSLLPQSSVPTNGWNVWRDQIYFGAFCVVLVALILPLLYFIFEKDDDD